MPALALRSLSAKSRLHRHQLSPLPLVATARSGKVGAIGGGQIGRVSTVEVARVETEAVAAPQPQRLARRVSLVIPAFNEERRIGPTLEAAHAYLASTFTDFELLLVDDGSSDRTAEIGSAFADRHEKTRVITIPHAGKAAAVRRGLSAATGDYVAFTDADLATPLSYLLSFVIAADAGGDVVIGSREGMAARRVGEPLYRHVMGRVFNRIVQFLLLPGIQDTQCGFKLFKRESVDRILDRARLYRDANTVAGPRVTAFDVELLVVARALGHRIDVQPVVWTYGRHSKVNPITDTFNNLTDILSVRWNLTLGRYR